MSSWKLFLYIFKQTHMTAFLRGFALFYIVCCVLIWLLDPSITSLGDAFWFGFMIITTIGFGDYTVVHWSSRLVTAALGIYGIVIIAFTCGVAASYFFAKIKSGRDESVSQMLWQLEHVDSLSDEQISDLQRRVRQVRENKEALKARKAAERPGTQTEDR